MWEYKENIKLKLRFLWRQKENKLKIALQRQMREKNLKSWMYKSLKKAFPE